MFGQQLALQFDSQQYFAVAPSRRRAVAPDGRLLMMRPNDDRSRAPELRVIVNWLGDLRRAR